MKIAVISDAHANLPALEAVIADIMNEDCEKIFHLGDAIAIGACSSEVIELMLHYDAKLIMGNHEAYHLSRPEIKPEKMSKGEFEHHEWVAGTLGRLHNGIIKKCVFHHNEIVNGFSLSFMHFALDKEPGSGRRFKAITYELTEDNIDEVFGEDNADIVFFGHLHKVIDITGATGKRYINPGSLGCQKGEQAEYCIVNIKNGTYSVDHRLVNYNKAKALAELDTRKVPHREFIKKVFYGLT